MHQKQKQTITPDNQHGCGSTKVHSENELFTTCLLARCLRVAHWLQVNSWTVERSVEQADHQPWVSFAPGPVLRQT